MPGIVIEKGLVMIAFTWAEHISRIPVVGVERKRKENDSSKNLDAHFLHVLSDEVSLLLQITGVLLKDFCLMTLKM